MIYSDRSKAERVEGMVGGGWFETSDIRGGVAIGGQATISDGEVAGMEAALQAVGNDPVLILSDFQAAIMAVRRASRRGIARTRGLREVVSLISQCEIEHVAGAVTLAWVKAHVGIARNMRTDLESKAAVGGRGGKAEMEVGIRALLKEGRKKARVVRGFGIGRVVRWSGRLAVIAYSQLRMGKGWLAACKYKI